MTDMMAVLLGAGSDKAARILAGLGGKPGAQEATAGALAPADGLPPFTALLRERMDAEVAVDVPQPPESVVQEPAPPAAELPADVASQATEGLAGDALAQALMASFSGREGGVASASGGTDSGADHAVQAGAGVFVPGYPEPRGRSLGAGTSRTMAGMEQAKGEGASPRSAAISAASRQMLPGGAAEEMVVAGDGHADAQGGAALRAIPAVPVPASIAQTLAAAVQDGAAQSIAPSPAVGGATAGLGPVHPGAVADGMPRAPHATLHLAVEAPVRGPMFSQELGERVVWLSARQGQVAEIALNPPHLGPLEVKLSLSGNEAGAQFYSPHAPVREAIEAALPRLREMLAEAGVTLGQTQVRDQALPRGSGFGQESTRGEPLQEEAATAAQGPSRGATSMGIGLVDLYI